MPVPPPEPFNPKLYEIEGDPVSVGGSHAEWTSAANHLYRMAADVASSIADLKFEGPEAELWRDKGRAHIEAINGAARGIQMAGDGLGLWGEALARAQAMMAPVLAAAQVDYANLVRAFQRVVAADIAEATAHAALVAAQTELQAAMAAAAATSGIGAGAVAAASAHVSQATTELARATAEVAAAHQDHQASRMKFDSTNAEAHGIQTQLGGQAHSASTQVNSGTKQADTVQQSMAEARAAAQSAAAGASTAAGAMSTPAQAAQAFTNGFKGTDGGADGTTDSNGGARSQTTPNSTDDNDRSGGAPVAMPGLRSGSPDKGKDKKKRDEDPDEDKRDDQNEDAEADDQDGDEDETAAATTNGTDPSGNTSGGGQNTDDLGKKLSEAPRQAMTAATSLTGVATDLLQSGLGGGQKIADRQVPPVEGVPAAGDVLRKYPGGAPEYIYQLPLPNGARVTLNDDGTASLIGDDGRSLGQIPVPTAFDGAGNKVKTWLGLNNQDQLVQHFAEVPGMPYPIVAGPPVDPSNAGHPLEQVAKSAQSVSQVTSQVTQAAQQAVQTPLGAAQAVAGLA
ncbi:MAG: hypothetical protein QM634_05150, partial [Gordonia sp. (in: high G+C Gram-positive bacteria)]